MRLLAFALVLIGALSPTFAEIAAAAPTPPAERRVLITGANRGLGLALAQYYAAQGFAVVATARKPGEATELAALAANNRRVVLETLDVTDDASIAALARKYDGVPIDILINNAGVIGDVGTQAFGAIAYAQFDDLMRTNVRAPLRISEAFAANVAASKSRKIVAITSRAGSLSRVEADRAMLYRTSKAALNMVMRNIAAAVKARGIVVCLVDPGAVETDMTAAAKDRSQFLKAGDAARQIAKLVDTYSVSNSGAFLSIDGTELPW